MSENDYLAHYGVLGMKWGKRKGEQPSGSKVKYEPPTQEAKNRAIGNHIKSMNRDPEKGDVVVGENDAKNQVHIFTVKSVTHHPDPDKASNVSLVHMATAEITPEGKMGKILHENKPSKIDRMLSAVDSITDVAYLTMAHDDLEEGEELVHYGVPGMKWGVRRSRSARAAAASERKASPKKDGDDKPDHLAKAKPNESPSERYDRLAAAAKSGQAKNMSEEDLKFFNARTEALNKVNRLNQVDPGWMSKTTKKVVQQTAEQTIQSVASAVANKYISGPAIKKITGAPEKAGK